MKKFSIDKLKSLGIVVALAGGLVLPGCAKTDNYILIEESFYDSNSEGTDDVFEERAFNSTERINRLAYLENCINAIKAINKIDFSDVTADDLINSKYEKSGFSLIDSKERYRKYLELEKNGNSDELFDLKVRLRKDFQLLNMYIMENADNDLYDFGTGLYKAIILDTADLEGSENNVKARVDILDAEKRTYGLAEYTSDDGFYTSIKIADKSLLYKLVGETSKYDPDNKKEEEFHIYEIDEKKFSDIEDTLKLYKECIYSEFVLENDFGVETLNSRNTNVPISYVKAK